jgi:hypothetical protein
MTFYEFVNSNYTQSHSSCPNFEALKICEFDSQFNAFRFKIPTYKGQFTKGIISTEKKLTQALALT